MPANIGWNSIKPTHSTENRYNGIAWRGTGTFNPGTLRTYKSGEGWSCFDDHDRKINATMLSWKTGAGKLESDLKTDAYNKPTVAEISEALESPAKADCK